MNKEFEQFAHSLSFWDKLNQAEKEKICNNVVKVHYVKGQNVHGGKNRCAGVIYVQQGCLRTYLLSPEGREITLYRLNPTDTCMLSASCIIKSITFDVFIDAEEDTDAFLINPTVYKEITDENIYLQNIGLNIAVTRFSDVMWAMQQILFMSLDSRIAVFLVDESVKNNSDTIRLTQEQIAKYTGSAREAVSRMLKYFAQEKILKVERGSVEILDKKALKKHINEI